jgi:hypothetical protein
LVKSKKNLNKEEKNNKKENKKAILDKLKGIANATQIDAVNDYKQN